MIKKTRKSDREICFIRAFVSGSAGQVRDITSRGMKIALFGSPDITRGEGVNVKIVPEESMRIKPFYVRGTVRWIKKEASTFVFGLHYSDDANMSVLVPLKKIIRSWK